MWKVDLKRFHHKQNIVTMYGDGCDRLVEVHFFFDGYSQFLEDLNGPLYLSDALSRPGELCPSNAELLISLTAF